MSEAPTPVFVATGSSTQNYLQSNKAVLRIPALQNFELNCTAYTIPEVYGVEASMGTPFSDIHFAPSKLVFEPLVVTFKVDEKMRNWKQLFSWIAGLTRPTRYAEFANQITDYGDGTMHIFDMNNNEVMRLRFMNIFPVRLDSIKFDTATSLALDCGAVFRYDTYTIDSENQATPVVAPGTAGAAGQWSEALDTLAYSSQG